ncbi:MAG: hypothetical protein GXN99_01395, partial [Candidatus Nanohaloarchaeota archaeon]|nr:hypothetical protein [Candidatus Nanohaloarchaeota archaeon]
MRKGAMLSLFVLMFLAGFIANAYASDMVKLVRVNFEPSVSGPIEGKVFGYACLDASCSQVDDTGMDIYTQEAWNCLQTSNSLDEFEQCIAPYKVPEGAVLSLSDGVYGMVRMRDISYNKKYALFVFSKGYVGDVIIFNIDNPCSNPICFDNVIANSYQRKIEELAFQLENLQLENYHNRNDPLFITMPVKVSSQVCNALRFNGMVGYFPPEDGEIVDYRIDGYVDVIIKNSMGQILFNQREPVSILPQSCSSEVSFTWTPTQTGEITVNWKAKVEDEQVINGKISEAIAKTVVYDPQQAACQSILTSLRINDEEGNARIGSSDVIRITFEYKSQAYVAPDEIYPVDSYATIKIINKATQQVVYEDTVLLPSQNIFELKTYSFTIPEKLEPGSYSLLVSVRAEDNDCAQYGLTSNEEVTYTLDFEVYSDEYEVEFIVQDNRDRSPIEGAEIEVRDRNSNDLLKILQTNADGRAVFLLPGERGYAYEVSKEGYESSYGVIYWLTTNLKIFVSLFPSFSYDDSNAPPSILSFTASPDKGTAPLTVTFSYAVSDPDGDALTCYFDANNDGS